MGYLPFVVDGGGDGNDGHQLDRLVGMFGKHSKYCIVSMKTITARTTTRQCDDDKQIARERIELSFSLDNVVVIALCSISPPLRPFVFAFRLAQAKFRFTIYNLVIGIVVYKHQHTHNRIEGAPPP